VHRYSFVNVTRAEGLVNPVDLLAPMDAAELMGPAELGDRADPAADGPAEALVASGISPAGASGQNERRMDS
jgi:hypothetical protein